MSAICLASLSASKIESAAVCDRRLRTRVRDPRRFIGVHEAVQMVQQEEKASGAPPPGTRGREEDAPALVEPCPPGLVERHGLALKPTAVNRSSFAVKGSTGHHMTTGQVCQQRGQAVRSKTVSGLSVRDELKSSAFAVDSSMPFRDKLLACAKKNSPGSAWA